MADNDHTDLPRGVSLVRTFNAYEVFHGEESDLLAAGMVRSEWLAEWSGLSRQIALDSNGEFRIIHEGKGNGLKACHRDAGAISIKRLKDGSLELTKHRTTSDRRERERIRDEEWRRQRASEDWKKAKQARDDEQDFVGRWKRGVAQLAANLRGVASGQSRFEGFPDIKLPAPDLARMEAIMDELQRELSVLRPIVADIESKDNVIRLRAFAHSAMSATH